MDLMAELREINYSPEAIRARRARQEARARLVYDQIGRALNKPAAIRQAGGPGWNIMPDEDVQEGHLIGQQHPGAAALLVVRQKMSEYHIATKYDLRYRGMRRLSGHGAFNMEDGIVFVQAQLQSVSGPRHFVDIPVAVTQGRILAPSIMFHQGVERVLTQHTFDDIIGLGEFKRKTPDRLNMFSPPPDKGAAPETREVPLVRPGMFAVMPTRMLRSSSREESQAMIRGALRGHRAEPEYKPTLRVGDRYAWSTVGGQYFEGEVVELDANVAFVQLANGQVAAVEDAGRGPWRPMKTAFYEPQVSGKATGPRGPDVPGAGGSHLDPAERPTDNYLWPGAIVRATRAIEVRGRDGMRFVIDRGEEGEVVRDVDGTNRGYYVRWYDLGYAANAPRDALKLT
jgi:hypothetical protein